jgi:hypothetical protein
MEQQRRWTRFIAAPTGDEPANDLSLKLTLV